MGGPPRHPNAAEEEIDGVMVEESFLDEESNVATPTNTSRVASFLRDEDEEAEDITKNSTRIHGSEDIEEGESFVDEDVTQKKEKPTRLPKQHKVETTASTRVENFAQAMADGSEHEYPAWQRVAIIVGFMMIVGLGIVLATREPHHADDDPVEPAIQASDFNNVPDESNGGTTDLFNWDDSNEWWTPVGVDSLRAAHTNFHDNVLKNVDELYELK